MTIPERQRPFQLDNPLYDPIGTTREERLPEGTNIWVLEEAPLRRVGTHRWCRWRCVYAAGEHLSGMIGETVKLGDAAGFIPTGAVPGTPAAAAWRQHTADPIEAIAAEARAEVREALKGGKKIRAVRTVRRVTGWGLVQAREYVEWIGDEMARDEQIMAAVKELEHTDAAGSE